MENGKQNSAEDSRERLNIINQITSDGAVTLDDCLASYLKTVANKDICESSIQNLSRILKVKGFEQIEIESLKSQLKNLPYRINERKVEEEKRVNERKIEEAKLKKLELQKEDEFFRSDKYKYIKQFAKKYGDKASDLELINLQKLLSNNQYDFSIDKLAEFIKYENWEKFDRFINERVFVDRPSTLREAIKNFLEHCNPDDSDMFISFAFLLKENGFDEIVSVDGNDILFDFLRAKIQKIEKEIELESFEKRLNEEDEQLWLEDIDQFNGYEFEDFLKNLFSKMNYRVEQTKLSGDQGADLVIVKFGEKTVIQAKRSNGKIGNKAVQEIMAAISLYQAQKGMVVTNNYFTPAAIELAYANEIELIDRDGLEELINKHW